MENITLRPYQEAAIGKIIWSQEKGLEGNEICVLPTGAGKSIVIAHLAKQANQPVLILQPGKEILTQNRAKLALYVPEGEIGTYSASMNERTIKRYTFATIQSIYTHPQDFAHFKLVLIDECHGLNQDKKSAMFTSFLREIGNPKVIGFTATPYRLATAYRKNPYGKGAQSFTAIKLINRYYKPFWSRIMFNVNNADLLKAGYLCPLKYYADSNVQHGNLASNKSKSDFDLPSYERMIGRLGIDIAKGVRWAEDNAKSVLVFCSSVAQAESLAAQIPGSASVSAKTKPKERDRIISAFKAGEIKTVFNVGVLTTGFDHPGLDCIIMARPTRSLALHYQMLGRGVRTAPGKTHCKVIDLSGNVASMGRIETIRLERLGGKGEQKWELLTETGSWHNKELYSYDIK